MAGNSSRKGAVRKPASKKSGGVGSGGKNKARLTGRGPTPKASDRPYHPAAKKAASKKVGVKKAAAARADGKAAAKGSGKSAGPRSGSAPARSGSKGQATRASSRQAPRAASKSSSRPSHGDWVIGRNATLEALQSKMPVDAVYVMTGIDMDDRVRAVLDICRARRLPLLDASRSDLDRMTGKAAHQGVVMRVPAFTYADAASFLKSTLPLIVVLDGITDPRNLGAIIRSAAAFGVTGVVVPERRAAGVTPAAWKTSAGAAARVPVAQVTNVVRTLKEFKEAGCFVIGLDAGGKQTVAQAADDLCDGPTVLVIGAEGAGISRLARQTCDVVASINMTGDVESLNASVAASIALYEAARVRNARSQ